ncbi:2-haloacrylate reductase [Pedobacter sp. Bi36]|nr:2-haloacrylate reductase [Pedobacter sp. Bi36]CAH0198108.1 2-haloacrylate reductase [Pedobacter sp. Bi126]
MTENMKAVVLKEFGAAENLYVEEVPLPSIGDNEVMVQVKAFSVNPVEAHVHEVKDWWSLVSLNTPAAPYIILGWDIAGVITEVGQNVVNFKKGDEVFGMINFLGLGAGYAEYVSAPEVDLAMKPSNISFEEAAGATMAAQTAYVSLVGYGKIKKGDKIVVTGASGGVGHYAVQIAKYFGAYVIGVASEANREFVLGLGADEFVDYSTQNFEELVKDADMVHDAVWKNDESHIARSLLAIKPGGTLLSVMVYPSAEFIENAKKEKDVTVTRMNVTDTKDHVGDIEAIRSLLESGAIKSYISQTFTIEDTYKAHQQIETHSTKGKIVIKL